MPQTSQKKKFVQYTIFIYVIYVKPYSFQLCLNKIMISFVTCFYWTVIQFIYAHDLLSLLCFESCPNYAL